ncbi:MAG: hypothetical protein K2L87_06230 [Clostridiales bacterium]|nr:hypothetical protein [Clostridiales bacterium]
MQEQNCGNCKYFSEYYTKFKTHIHRTAGGLCLCDKFRRRRVRQKKESDAPCEYWERKEGEKEEEVQLVKNALVKIAERLEELTIILKDT